MPGGRFLHENVISVHDFFDRHFLKNLEKTEKTLVQKNTIFVKKPFLINFDFNVHPRLP
jgi:hypothetical protein